MNKICLICLLSFGYLACNSAKADVTVIVNQQQYVFANEPRLVEVLAPIAGQQNWYWPAAALYEVADNSLEDTRLLVLNQLSLLAEKQGQNDRQLKLAIENLAADITKWRLANRLPIAIDYDLARIKSESNPQFTQGKYILRLAPRSKIVHVLGAVDYSQQIAHQPHTDISGYLTDVSFTKLADKNIVMLIQADGRVITAPAAYWNKTHQEVMPGSQLYVPFKQSLFTPELSKINQQILKLAVNRVL